MLLKEDIQYGGHMMQTAYSDGTRHYTAEDFVPMRAERILLGARAAQAAKRGSGFDVTGSMIEPFIQGSKMPLKVTTTPSGATATACSAILSVSAK